MFSRKSPSSAFLHRIICKLSYRWWTLDVVTEFLKPKPGKKSPSLRCKAVMYEYVGQHYILIHLTFPLFAQPTSQDAPIRPNSNLWSLNQVIFQQTSDLMKDAAALCHSVLHCWYTHSFMWVSSSPSALWSSLVKSGWRIPAGMKAYNYPQCTSRPRGHCGGKIVITECRFAAPCSSSSPVCHPYCWPSSPMIHVITLSSLHQEHSSLLLAHTRCPLFLNLHTAVAVVKKAVVLERLGSAYFIGSAKGSLQAAEVRWGNIRAGGGWSCSGQDGVSIWVALLLIHSALLWLHCQETSLWFWMIHLCLECCLSSHCTHTR